MDRTLLSSNALTALSLLAVTSLAWMSTVRADADMQMGHGVELQSWAAGLRFVLQWGVMMTAMMLPSAAPMVLMYRAISRQPNNAMRVISAEGFAVVYIVVWLLTGVPVYLASTAVSGIASRSAELASLMPYALAATLLGAGVYQLSSAKRVCLRQCEAPMNFLMRRWRPGYVGSLRLAWTHAAYCVGCCWALMAVLVTAGAMSLPWVLAIALVVFAEKVLPGGERSARVVGFTLIVAGLIVALRPELASALRPGMH